MQKKANKNQTTASDHSNAQSRLVTPTQTNMKLSIKVQSNTKAKIGTCDSTHFKNRQLYCFSNKIHLIAEANLFVTASATMYCTDCTWETSQSEGSLP